MPLSPIGTWCGEKTTQLVKLQVFLTTLYTQRWHILNSTVYYRLLVRLYFYENSPLQNVTNN